MICDPLEHLAEVSLPDRGHSFVGQVMAKNPVPLIIPCYRLLAAGVKVGGFSRDGRLDGEAADA